jgi:ABC-type nitrate/sulfonate/bicarbonate transport system substrate-binding protein
MARRSKLFIALAIIGLAALGYWVLRSPTVSHDRLIRVGTLRHESSLPLYVAKEMGYFDELPFRVELVELPVADHMPALLARRVEVLSPTSFPVLMNVMGESPGSVYALFPGAERLEGAPVYGFVVKRSFAGQSVRDLRGGVIIAINATTALNIPSIMQAAGVAARDVPQVKQASREAAIQAVTSGTAVAAIMDQPALAAAEDSPDLKVIEPNPRARYIHNPYWSGAGGVLASTWQARQADMRALVAAVDRGVAFARANPGRAREILSKYTGVSLQVAKRSGGYYFPLTSEAVPMTDVATTASSLQAAGLIKHPIDPKRFFPPGLYR